MNQHAVLDAADNRLDEEGFKVYGEAEDILLQRGRVLDFLSVISPCAGARFGEDRKPEPRGVGEGVCGLASGSAEGGAA